MSEAEIKQKLIDNGLENYIKLFQDNHLFDEKVLYEMTNEDYISIGVTILGDRKKLLLLFKPTKESSPELGDKILQMLGQEKDISLQMVMLL